MDDSELSMPALLRVRGETEVAVQNARSEFQRAKFALEGAEERAEKIKTELADRTAKEVANAIGVGSRGPLPHGERRNAVPEATGPLSNLYSWQIEERFKAIEKERDEALKAVAALEKERDESLDGLTTLTTVMEEAANTLKGRAEALRRSAQYLGIMPSVFLRESQKEQKLVWDAGAKAIDACVDVIRFALDHAFDENDKAIRAAQSVSASTELPLVEDWSDVRCPRVATLEELAEFDDIQGTPVVYVQKINRLFAFVPYFHAEPSPGKVLKSKHVSGYGRWVVLGGP